MTYSNKHNACLKIILPLILISFQQILLAQKNDCTAKINYFGGAVTIQSKGISKIIPLHISLLLIRLRAHHRKISGQPVIWLEWPGSK